jgi:hypothetical protein
LKKLRSDFGSEWGEVILADVKDRIRPPIDRDKLRDGDDLLATALRRLDGYQDVELVTSFKEILKAEDYNKLAEVGDEDGDHEVDGDVKVQSAYGAHIRDLVERFLIEAIRDDNEETVTR